MEKIKKILKSWLIISIAVLVMFYLSPDPDLNLIYFALGIYVFITIFILAGFDKYVSYGDDDKFPPADPKYENEDEDFY